MTKKKTTWLKVGCSPPLKTQLTEYSETKGLTQAETLRRALAEFFERQEGKS